MKKESVASDWITVRESPRAHQMTGTNCPLAFGNTFIFLAAMEVNAFSTTAAATGQVCTCPCPSLAYPNARLEMRKPFARGSGPIWSRPGSVYWSPIMGMINLRLLDLADLGVFWKLLLNNYRSIYVIILFSCITKHFGIRFSHHMRSLWISLEDLGRSNCILEDLMRSTQI